MGGTSEHGYIVFRGEERWAMKTNRKGSETFPQKEIRPWYHADQTSPREYSLLLTRLSAFGVDGWRTVVLAPRAVRARLKAACCMDAWGMQCQIHHAEYSAQGRFIHIHDGYKGTHQSPL